MKLLGVVAWCALRPNPEERACNTYVHVSTGKFILFVKEIMLNNVDPNHKKIL